MYINKPAIIYLQVPFHGMCVKSNHHKNVPITHNQFQYTKSHCMEFEYP